MTLKTFFNKFDQFADAPDAVIFSANGAIHTSLGHRPRKGIPTNIRALKGRTMVSSAELEPGWNAPSGLNSFANSFPRAMPWAGMERPVGAEDNKP
jgi:hypothetical protein